MPTRRSRIRRSQDACPLAIDTATQSIVVRVSMRVQVNVDPIGFRNRLKKCVRMHTRMHMTMRRVRLQLIPVLNGAMRSCFVLVLFLCYYAYFSRCFDRLFAWRERKIASRRDYLGIGWTLYCYNMDWVVDDYENRIDVVFLQ